MEDTRVKPGPKAETLSLHPLSPDEAVRAILRVPAESQKKQVWNKALVHQKKR